MNEIVPVADSFTKLIHGISECQQVAAQVGLAQEVLYRLGLDASENVPPLQKGQSLHEYVQQLDQDTLARVEAMGIGQGQKIEEALRTAARLILYDQYVTGRWRHYASELDTDQWSPYVTHILDSNLNLSDGEARRWATAIEVIAQIYERQAKDRFGLTFCDDLVIDHETGEVDTSPDAQKGLPSSPEQAIIEYFNRFGREAGVKLRDLLGQLDHLPLVYWDRLLEYRQEGYLEDEDRAANELGWDRESYKDNRRLYETVSEVRRILDLASTPSLTAKQVNRQATGGKSVMPEWVLPDDAPPEWRAYLTAQYPDKVSATGSTPMGQRHVQVRLTVWPICKICVNSASYEGIMGITPDGYICSDCGGTTPVVTTKGKMRTKKIWQYRIADEYGHYKEEWTESEQSKWELGIAQTMDVFGLPISLWEISLSLEELDES